MINRDACLQRRMDFTPLVYSVEGIPGRDAQGAKKKVLVMMDLQLFGLARHSMIVA